MIDSRSIWRTLFSTILSAQLMLTILFAVTITVYFVGNFNFVLSFLAVVVSLIVISYKSVGLWSVWSNSSSGISVYIAADLVFIAILCIFCIVFHVILSDAFVLKYYYNFILEDYGTMASGITAFMDIVDVFQVKYSCCGVLSFTDFMDASWKTNHKKIAVPPSCCKIQNRLEYLAGLENLVLQDDTCPSNPTSKNSYFQFPCTDAIMKTATNYRAKADLAFGVTMLLEIFCIFFAWTIARNIEEMEICQERLDYVRVKCSHLNTSDVTLKEGIYDETDDDVMEQCAYSDMEDNQSESESVAQSNSGTVIN